MAWLDEELLGPMGWPRLRSRAAAPRASLLLGRADLQARLAAAWAQALGGLSSMLVLVGPSGIGKTRLLDWIAGEARGAGALVLRGRARASERVPYNALDGVVDALARHLMHTGDDEQGELGRAAAAAFPVFGEATRSAGQAEAFAAVTALLARAARASGAVVAIDDHRPRGARARRAWTLAGRGPRVDRPLPSAAVFVEISQTTASPCTNCVGPPAKFCGSGCLPSAPTEQEGRLLSTEAHFLGGDSCGSSIWSPFSS